MSTGQSGHPCLEIDYSQDQRPPDLLDDSIACDWVATSLQLLTASLLDLGNGP